MFLFIIIINLVTGLSAISESAQDKSQDKYHDEKGIKIIDKNQIPYYLFKNDNKIANYTYPDIEENMLRVPKNFYENINHKKPTLKKPPKRTIQKIIKKGKSKTRRLYVNAATRTPTQETEYDERIKDNQYTQSTEELTTEVNRKRKFRKNYQKLARYPMPFHSLQSKNSHRIKRETDRDLYILQDLDEMEFLSRDSDNNIVVKAHVKPFW